jgi:hypothetical protein
MKNYVYEKAALSFLRRERSKCFIHGVDAIGCFGKRGKRLWRPLSQTCLFCIHNLQGDKCSMFRSILVIALLSQAACFVPTSPVARLNGPNGLRCGSKDGRSASNVLTSIAMKEEIQGHGVYRRDILKLLIGGAATTLVGGFNADAYVYFDTERYGDKELKVAFINQVKQQFRALYEKKPELIVPLFRLAMTDALTVRHLSLRCVSSSSHWSSGFLRVT